MPQNTEASLMSRKTFFTGTSLLTARLWSSSLWRPTTSAIDWLLPTGI